MDPSNVKCCTILPFLKRQKLVLKMLIPVMGNTLSSCYFLSGYIEVNAVPSFEKNMDPIDVKYCTILPFLERQNESK